MSRSHGRRHLATAFVLGFATLASGYSGTYTAGMGITGTAHDLGTTHNGMSYGALPGDRLQRVCIYCHTPHDAERTIAGLGSGAGGIGGEVDYVPLWNHDLSARVGAYVMYDGTGGRISRAAAAGMEPGAASLLCLGCHDGSVAVNAYGSRSQRADSRGGGGAMIAARYVVGRNGDLSNHHPIGFDYDAVQTANANIRPADTAAMGGAGTVRDHLYGPGATRMECGTCHATHNAGNTGESLLWRSDVRSQLCLTCHDLGVNPGASVP